MVLGAQQVNHLLGVADGVGFVEIAAVAMHSLTANLLSKTYMAGLSDFFRVINDPAYRKVWLRNQVATAAVPNVVAQFARGGDDATREAYTVIEAIKRRTPGLSETLPARRNILGEVITPIGGYVPWVDTSDPQHFEMLPRMLSPAAITRKSSDVVVQELASLRHGVTDLPRTLDGLDLTAVYTTEGRQALDRWKELTGEIAPGGVNVHQALDRLVKSPAYQALPQPPKDPNDLFNPRKDAVMRVLSRYREAAKRQLIQETPALREHMQQQLQGRVSKMEAAGALLERLKAQ